MYRGDLYKFYERLENIRIDPKILLRILSFHPFFLYHRSRNNDAKRKRSIARQHSNFSVRREKKEGGEKRRILALDILAELREAGIPLPYSPIAANPQVRRNSLFRRGKYLIPRPRGKTGYCQWLAATTTTTCHIPHPAISAT